MTIENNRDRVTVLSSHSDLAELLLDRALTSDGDYGDDLARTRAELKAKLDEQAPYSSRQQIVSDLETSERCSKFSSGRPNFFMKRRFQLTRRKSLNIIVPN
ncbi:hypothetical protein PsorP6_000350 [Peronosclerospora sorghi]|uniref:Uncharacterized protein n=1 Tax=Peronosclerospora sorghi TaxID=230839 RepID=A0ACC0WZL0_9STRA|nr:hypothetical protein PsorP6_000350 [Peronosclerospora sorghi]